MTAKAKALKDIKHHAHNPERAKIVGGQWNVVDYKSSGENEGRGEEALDVSWGRDNEKDDEEWMLIHTIVEKGAHIEPDDEEWEKI